MSQLDSQLTQSVIQYFFGIIIGITICKNLYRDVREYPNFAPTIPFLGITNGHQKIFNIRIHHWIYGICISSIAITFDYYVIAGTAFAFMIHGLSYPDAFDFT